MGNLLAFLRDVRAELAKVSWPSRRQTMMYTLTVVAITFVIAIYLGLIDLGLSRLLNFIITR
ncbi:MAG: preprotein translocase subunit SecE [Patescibacteria group bacterium]